MDTRFVARVEGVNFGSTIYDTQDLSTIRGASLALLAMSDAVLAALDGLPGVAEVKVLTKGASQLGVSFCAGPSEAERIREAITSVLRAPGADGQPFHVLTFVVDVVACKGDGADAIVAGLDEAQARNRARQLRQWTTDLPAFTASAKVPDPFDRKRPAIARRELPEGTALLSPSVAERRDYGRKMRQGFYKSHAPQAAGRLSDQRLRLVDDFASLVEAPPDGPSTSVKSHMALVYADGNRFGAIAKAVGPERFSRELLSLQEKLLGDVLDWFADGAKGPNGDAFFLKDRETSRLRLETLMWGGDELIFVMPAWLAFAFIESFCRWTRNWAIEGHPLTFAVGAAVVNRKSPVRQVRWLAKEVADASKDACDDLAKSLAAKAARSKGSDGGKATEYQRGSTVSIEIFESLSIPERELADFRKGLYGSDADVGRDLTFPADAFGSLRRHIASMASGEPDASLHRSQVYRILSSARWLEGGLAGDDADYAASRELEDYFARVRAHPNPRTAIDALRLPRLPGAMERSLASELVLIASFWDYADPLGDLHVRNVA